MTDFALIGAAGFIAPRHMKAIKDTGNNLVAAVDNHDSVGVIDNYFPEAEFFTEIERFDRHLDKLRRQNKKVDYVSICTPNYLHDAHIRLALRNHANAICEKPVIINPWNIDALKEIEKETLSKIFVILQLRLHPAIIDLRSVTRVSRVYDVTLDYVTSRGKWYDVSWKGDENKSGGIVTNIGIHFFDMLTYVFGDVREIILHHMNKDTARGFMRLDRANVNWFLSTNKDNLPKGYTTSYRSMTVNNQEIDFSSGFTDLHTESYNKILNGQGFTLDDARQSIETVYKIRHEVQSI